MEPHAMLSAQKTDMALSETLLNALPQAVLMVDQNHAIIKANDSAQTFFRISKKGLLKLNLDTLIHVESPVISLLEQVKTMRTPVSSYRMHIANPAYAYDHVADLYIASIPDDPHHYLLTFLEKGIADRIERQMTYQGAARTVSGLSAMLAHEIKNPLSGIKGAAQLLETNLCEEDRELTTLIQSESERIVKLVDRMEVFTDERPVERAEINIHGVLDHVIKLAQNGFGKDVRFIQHYDPSIPPIAANKDQLIQVFLNLVKNACEAFDDKQRKEIILTTAYKPGVHLTMSSTGEKIKLPFECTVSDNGPGISDALIAHIFDPFITTKANGSGLGLALVAKIIRDHGGIIEFDRRDHLSIFRLLLPLETKPFNAPS